MKKFKFTIEELSNLETLILDKEMNTHIIANNLKEFIAKELAQTKNMYEIVMTRTILTYLLSTIDIRIESVSNDDLEISKLYQILDSLVKQDRELGLVNPIESEGIKHFYI